MKILDVTEFYSERGGVRGHLDVKGQVLRQAGHHHVVVAPGAADATGDLAGSDGSREGSARVLRIAGPTLPYDANYHLLWRIDKARRLVARERADVVEINSPYLAPLCTPSGCEAGIRTFFWHADFVDAYVRSFVGRYSTQAAERMATSLWAWVRNIAGRCDATFAASSSQVRKLRANGLPRVHQISFGVHRRVFAPSARSDAWRAEITGGRSDVSILVAVGRLAVEKEWPLVLEAFSRLPNAAARVVLIYGDGPERARLERLARGRGDIRFMGFEKDQSLLARAMASADAVVHGCSVETFGLSLAQAAACGTPLIVPDAGGAVELADSSCCEMYRARSAEACARAIERASARGWEKLRAKAVEQRARVADARDQIAVTLEMYRDLLERKRKGTYGDSRLGA